ncbi:MAG TPA: NUDIX domain-containing protein, partial [Phycisphaerales bacterium]|nr:NUDIX domain-containing protein [Phycisphaerales bacterium]
AKIIQNDFRGRFPQTVADLRKLPGVGRYTAGAIASIVFGRPEPIVDGNVKRVLGRVDAEKFDSPRHADAWSWIRAEELVSAAENPGVFNEALMELGATICSPPPAVPKCGKCPIRRQCKGRISGIATLSVKGGTPDPKPVVHHHVMVISRTINRNPHVLMQQRKPQGMWAGMWEPFTLESDAPLSHAELKRILIAPPWPKGLRMSRVADFTHQTTHRQIEFHVMRAAVKTSLKSTSGLWVKVKSALDMPMGNAQRKALRLAIDDK